MMEKLVLQTYVPKEKGLIRMELVNPVMNTPELQVTIKAVLHRYVPLDKFSKKMDVVLSAIPTQELMLQAKSASLIIAVIEKNLDLMDLALSAPNMKELREQALLVDQINVTSDKESQERELAFTVNCTTLFAATEDAAQSLLANPLSSISPWMVFVALVHSTNRQVMMEYHAQQTQPRSFQTLK